MKLSKIEQETIIVFNEKERDVISITTCNKKLQNKLEKVGHFTPLYEALYDNCCSKEYIIPAKWLQLRKPLPTKAFLKATGRSVKED